jgi:hypothetical protein
LAERNKAISRQSEAEDARKEALRRLSEAVAERNNWEYLRQVEAEDARKEALRYQSEAEDARKEAQKREREADADFKRDKRI